jgi:hypothetical protein
MPVLLAVAVPLLVPLSVCQPGTGLCVLLAITVPLLVPVRVCQPGTGLCVLLAVAVPLLVPVLVCQPGTGMCVLLPVAVLLLLSGYGGHAVSGRQHVLGGGVHSNRNAIKYMSFT